MIRSPRLTPAERIYALHVQSVAEAQCLGTTLAARESDYARGVQRTAVGQPEITAPYAFIATCEQVSLA